LAMCPPATLQVPLFEMMRALGLLNTWLALILPNAVLSLPVCILVLVAFFKSLPESLEQAAMLDGCSRLGALWRIVLPLSLPGVITAGTLAFVNAWDEFLFALVLNAAPENRTLPVGILFYQGEFTFPWPLISAALIVGIVPLVVLIALSQQRLVGNLTAGGMKG
ncbi:MAG TPA: carbohydrate ABC transporter permease, partial [Cellvibrio sp.]